MADPNTSLDKSSSQPELSGIHKTPPYEYVNFRNKRPRPDDIKDQLNEFKNEIKEMISSIMKAGESERTLLRKDIADIKIKIQEVSNTNTDIEKSIDYMSKQFDDAITKVGILEKEAIENRAQIQILQDKIENLERTSFKSAIEVRNVPAKEKETVNDLTTTIINTGKALDLHIQKSDIRDCWRLPGKQGSNRTILAEFTTVSTKTKFLQQARSFNLKRANEDKLNTEHVGIAGKRMPIYVSEHLTSSSRGLFYLTREFARDQKYKFCWTSHGRIFLRKEEGSKQILIRGEKCLRDLKAQI